MGVSSSRESVCGFRVFKVSAHSPGEDAGLESFFDMITTVNGVALETENNGFVDVVASNKGRVVFLRVFNTKTETYRDVGITPSDTWGGNGLLGLTIRWDYSDSEDEYTWRVLDVHGNSPASEAGLEAFTDYVVGTSEALFKKAGDLDDAIRNSMHRPLSLWVYSSHTDSFREVVIIPRGGWGGHGYLGCDVGRGYLHRIPSRKAYATPPPTRTPTGHSYVGSGDLEVVGTSGTPTPASTPGPVPGGRPQFEMDLISEGAAGTYGTRAVRSVHTVHTAHTAPAELRPGYVYGPAQPQPPSQPPSQSQPFRPSYPVAIVHVPPTDAARRVPLPSQESAFSPMPHLSLSPSAFSSSTTAHSPRGSSGDVSPRDFAYPVNPMGVPVQPEGDPPHPQRTPPSPTSPSSPIPVSPVLLASSPQLLATRTGIISPKEWSSGTLSPESSLGPASNYLGRSLPGFRAQTRATQASQASQASLGDVYESETPPPPSHSTHPSLLLGEMEGVDCDA